jgi:hypothetical protein
LTGGGSYDTLNIYFPEKEDAYGLQGKGSVRRCKEDRDKEDRSKEEKIGRSYSAKGQPCGFPFCFFGITIRGYAAIVVISKTAAGKILSIE